MPISRKQIAKLPTANTGRRLAFVDLNIALIASVPSVTLTDVAVYLINTSSYENKMDNSISFAVCRGNNIKQTNKIILLFFAYILNFLFEE